jgi:hypothetical protein
MTKTFNFSRLKVKILEIAASVVDWDDFCPNPVPTFHIG